MNAATVIQILFNSLRLGSIVALATLGIVLIFRTSKATNFAQGSIGTFNAYIAAYFSVTIGLNVFLSMIIALVTAFITGVVIDKLFIRPAAKASIVSKQILTLGIILILLGIMNMNVAFLNRFFPPVTIRPDQFIPQSYALNILGARIEWNTIFIFVLTMVLMAIIFWFIQKTKWGLATRVTASNETIARLMGVPTKKVTMFAWAVAAMLGTIAGIALAPRVGINPNLLIGVQVGAFFAAVFGGFATFHGPVIAAYMIGFALSITRYMAVSVFSTRSVIAEIFIYALILVILYFKPYGIFGKQPERKV